MPVRAREESQRSREFGGKQHQSGVRAGVALVLWVLLDTLEHLAKFCAVDSIQLPSDPLVAVHQPQNAAKPKLSAEDGKRLYDRQVCESLSYTGHVVFVVELIQVILAMARETCCSSRTISRTFGMPTSARRANCRRRCWAAKDCPFQPSTNR